MSPSDLLHPLTPIVPPKPRTLTGVLTSSSYRPSALSPSRKKCPHSSPQRQWLLTEDEGLGELFCAAPPRERNTPKLKGFFRFGVWVWFFFPPPKAFTSPFPSCPKSARKGNSPQGEPLLSRHRPGPGSPAGSPHAPSLPRARASRPPVAPPTRPPGARPRLPHARQLTPALCPPC